MCLVSRWVGGFVGEWIFSFPLSSLLHAPPDSYSSRLFSISSLINPPTNVGFSTILKSDFRLSSELECLLTYTWDDKSTSKECKTKGRASLASKK